MLFEIIPHRFFSSHHCSPAFSFPHPINPVTYQQILTQQRGLSSAFGHTPPLIQPSPTFPPRQHMAVISVNPPPAQISSNSNCISDSSQVGVALTLQHSLFLLTKHFGTCHSQILHPLPSLNTHTLTFQCRSHWPWSSKALNMTHRAISGSKSPWAPVTCCWSHWDLAHAEVFCHISTWMLWIKLCWSFTCPFFLLMWIMQIVLKHVAPSLTSR